MIQVQAVRAFRGRPHEGIAGRIRKGTVLTVDERRAEQLERRGDAERVAAEAAPAPLPSGGRAGAAAPSSSSAAARRPRPRRSRPPGAAAPSSSSTMAAASPPGPTPSTPPTASGGGPAAAPGNSLDCG